MSNSATIRCLAESYGQLLLRDSKAQWWPWLAREHPDIYESVMATVEENDPSLLRIAEAFRDDLKRRRLNARGGRTEG